MTASSRNGRPAGEGRPRHGRRRVLVVLSVLLAVLMAGGVLLWQAGMLPGQDRGPSAEAEGPEAADDSAAAPADDGPDQGSGLSDDGTPQSPDGGQDGGADEGTQSDGPTDPDDRAGTADGRDGGSSDGSSTEGSDGQPDDGEGDPSDYDEGPDAGEASPEGLEPEGTRLTRALSSYLDSEFPASNLPGMAVAVFDQDGVRYERELGACTSAHQTFIIGSLSKSFTAVAIMQLVEQGLVDLDAPASTYVPQYQTPDSVTIRALLNQTSGFGYYDSLADATVGLTAGRFSYANANYDLLGRVIEAVSGMDYGSYLRDHIFDPLGMDDASAGTGELRGEQVPLYRNYFGLNVADGFVHQDSDEAWGTASSGYVRASLSDMEKYLQMYLNGGEGVLEPQDVERIFLDRVPDPTGDTYYGFGWTTFNWDDGELVCSHDGQVENGVARMCLLPDRSMGIVVLGDASDYFGGNANFFQMCDDVVSLAIGGDALGIDRTAVVHGHARVDVLLALVAAAAVWSVAGLRRWWRGLAGRERGVVWWRLFFLHAVLPAALVAYPSWQGILWRDLATFIPDVALTLGISAAVLVATGVAKLVAWLWWLHRHPRPPGRA